MPTTEQFTPTSDNLASYKSQLDRFSRLALENLAYVAGKNYAIETAPAQIAPDNRIPIPLAKSAVTNIIGYAGRPGQIKTDYRLSDAPEDADYDTITELLEQLDAYNEEGLENSELMANSLSTGIAYELWWTSDALNLPGATPTPEYKLLPITEGCPVWSDSLKPELIAFIRYWTESDDSQIADVYLPGHSERWRQAKSDRAQAATYYRDPSGDTTYPYKRVPVIMFRTNMHNSPVFCAEKPIIDAFDKLVSKTQNEVDRFNALITLFPGSVDSEFIRQLSEVAKPFISNLDEYDPAQWPRYLEKNLSGVNEFYTAQADRLERLFHKTINIPDMSDQQFAGAQSGVAIAYKLIGFEFLVSEIEVYFRKGLADRMDMYFDVIDYGTLGADRSKYEQVITWKRNLPVDDEAKVRIAAMLMGLGVSKETVLKFLPSSIIPDVLKELEKSGDSFHDNTPPDTGSNVNNDKAMQ